MAATTTSQLSCFSAINRQFHHRRHSLLCTTRPPQSWVVMSLEGSSDVNTTLSYTSDDAPKPPHVERAANLHSDAAAGNSGTASEPQLELGVAEQKRAAKIHDFCFGIPFGGIVLSGGLIGFIFTRNLSTLSSGVLYGGALLALSTFSLKIWRQGKSSLPFILGQGALAAALLWKNFQTYSLTKKVFPTGFYAAISAAMLCFYSYVLLSGGNPPPKKLKSSPSVAS
ncbi:protein FATTY ACID EXPORT 1, chloroplastic [Ziziphus jujuba]|uniref:Protein FATTY ACID EXPORT 1, chloroplastic n=1 Tax=Ziziphus jujuba TaxID=326968 RepID=A0A6P4AK02_ZIZJJ|nr:protein FATTY ACID EXPORT 1, chloroplastic [Ziziphus jujuba]